MSKLSMSAALATVNAAYGKPIRQSRTSYVAYVPYDITDERSPSTEIRYDCYWKILCALRYRKAIDALALMGLAAGYSDHDAMQLAWGGGMSVRGIFKQLAAERK